jgi:hypothetical protein
MCFKFLCSGLMGFRFETSCHITKIIEKCVGCDSECIYIYIYIYICCICYIKGDVSYKAVSKCFFSIRIRISCLSVLY